MGRTRAFAAFVGLLGLLLVQAELAAQPTLESGSVMEAAGRLKAGEFAIILSL